MELYPLGGAVRPVLTILVYSNLQKSFNSTQFKAILAEFFSGDIATRGPSPEDPDYSLKVALHNWHGLNVSQENVNYIDPNIGRDEYIALKTINQNKLYNLVFFVNPKGLNKYMPALRYMSNSFRILNSDNRLLTPFANVLGLQ
jgi:hypothetical protein